MQTNLTRRAALSGAVASVALTSVAAAAITAPAGSIEFRTRMDAAEVSRRRFNALPQDLEMRDSAAFEQEAAAMCQLSSEADMAVPTTWQEFGRWVEHLTDGGHFAIDGDNADRLVSHTRRLVKMEG